jgi:heavy metal sensor kinase
MSCARRPSFRRSLALRLTLWYAGLFLLLAGAAFALFYVFIATTLRERTDRELLAEARTYANVMGLQGVEALARRAALDSQAAGEKKIFIRLLTPDGRIFSASNMDYWREIFVSREALSRLAAEERPIFATMRSPDRAHEVRVVYAPIGPGLVLQLGHAMDDLARLIEAFRRTFVAAMAGLAAAAALIGLFMARRALSGVAAVTRTAQRIADGRLAERVPATGRGDEVDDLAATFNRMLDHIERLVAGIREMTDNIAHDLKSPITRIRGQAEMALTQGGAAADWEAVAASAVEECDRLLEMINTMLFISRSEAGVSRPAAEPLDLAALARDACGIFLAMAEEKGVELACETPESLSAAGDRRMLQRMLANLLDNAIKYTPAGGRVRVELTAAENGAAAIAVEDNGPGIAPEDRPHILERFYRGDPSRSQPGSGLGMSFARAVARAHGGEIDVGPGAGGGGSRFTVRLPPRPPGGAEGPSPPPGG